MKQFLIILILQGTVLSYALAKEMVSFVTFPVPRYVESAEKGEFIQLIKKLSNESGYDIQIEVYPAKRSLDMFTQNKYEGYFPALNIFNEQLKNTKIISTKPYYFKKDFLFYIKEYTTLNEKTVCLTRGYPYNNEYIKAHKMKEIISNSDESCVKMLLLGRVDFVLGELLTLVEIINKLESEREHLIKVVPEKVSSLPVFFSFRETDKSKALVKKLNKLLDRYQANGFLKDLFKAASKKALEKFNISYNPTIP